MKILTQAEIDELIINYHKKNNESADLTNKKRLPEAFLKKKEQPVVQTVKFLNTTPRKV